MAGSFRILAFIAGISCSFPVPSSSLVESATGSVKAGTTPTSVRQVRKGQRLATGSTIATGKNSQAILRFDDGQVVVLAASSEFAILDYSFSLGEPKKDRFVFNLHKGAIRSVSSLLTTRTRAAYVLQSPHATLGILGSDFMIALAGATYICVLEGAVAATNSAGSAVFGIGTTASIVSKGALATTIPASTFPPFVTASFKQMSSMAISTVMESRP